MALLILDSPGMHMHALQSYSILLEYSPTVTSEFSVRRGNLRQAVISYNMSVIAAGDL